MALVTADLRAAAGDVEVVRRSATAATVAPAGSACPRFGIEVHRERRRLLEVQSLAVIVDGPETGAVDAAVVLHHRGQVRRTGLAARLRGRERSAAEPVRDRLLAGGRLERASLPLDFTRFEVRPHAGRWRATLELMGGSSVRMRLPPSDHYVRLSADQVDALLATVAELHVALPGREPPGYVVPPMRDAGVAATSRDVPGDAGVVATSRVSRVAGSHLPRRR